MALFEVDILSDSELRSKLAEFGHPVGPVTETTREILIKKLKLLMKHKSSVKNANRSLSRFSSGDDSGSDTDQNGGNRNSKRISMPPPSSYRSSKRKTGTRNSTPDFSSVPSTSKVSCSTPIGPTRSNPDFRVNRYSLPSTRKISQLPTPNRSNISSPTLSYEFDSGSDSDIPDVSRSSPSHLRRRSGPMYGTLSSYRSRLNNSNCSSSSRSNADAIVSSLRNDNTKKPFLSSFVGRLSRMSGISDSVNPQDIKESDAEDDGSPEKLANINIASRNFNFSEWGGPLRTVYQHVKTKDTPVSTRWKSWNNSQLFSMLLLGLFILFFIWLALAYFRVTHKSALTKSNNHYPLCKDDEEGLASMTCIKKEELPFAVQLYREVHIELQARALQSLCGPVLDNGSVQKPYMTTRQVIHFLIQSYKTPQDIYKIEQGINNLRLLVIANKHWGITLVKDSDNFHPTADCAIPSERLAIPSDFSQDVEILFISPCPNIPWTCYVVRLFYKILFVIVCVALGASSMYLATVTIRYYRKTRQEEHEQVMILVERILEHVSECSERATTSATDANGSLSSLPQDYVAVRHVHDTLIHPSERQNMSCVWQKAVKFIEENESRIRTEVQQVWGEDATVWRWLGPPLNKSHTQTSFSEGAAESNVPLSSSLYPDLSSMKGETKKALDRVWQGEAFETCEGSMNSLPSSPTPCLKIRHMFKLNKDYGPDWVLKVKDAIVEKCEGARIIHLSVDKESKEGCVYVKCASEQDAGLAYRQLHGSWFDGALVTVKYLRLERYHERFPDSACAVVPLRPSNNLKLSLQGTSSS